MRGGRQDGGWREADAAVIQHGFDHRLRLSVDGINRGRPAAYRIGPSEAARIVNVMHRVNGFVLFIEHNLYALDNLCAPDAGTVRPVHAAHLLVDCRLMLQRGVLPAVRLERRPGIDFQLREPIRLLFGMLQGEKKTHFGNASHAAIKVKAEAVFGFGLDHYTGRRIFFPSVAIPLDLPRRRAALSLRGGRQEEQGGERQECGDCVFHSVRWDAEQRQEEGARKGRPYIGWFVVGASLAGALLAPLPVKPRAIDSLPSQYLRLGRSVARTRSGLGQAPIDSLPGKHLQRRDVFS